MRRHVINLSVLMAISIVAVLLVWADEHLSHGLGYLVYIVFLILAWLVISRLPLDDSLGGEAESRPSLRQMFREASQAQQAERPNQDLSG